MGSSAKDKTAPQRVAKYAQKMKDSGYVRVYLWARKEDREDIKMYAEKLRSDYKASAELMDETADFSRKAEQEIGQMAKISEESWRKPVTF